VGCGVSISLSGKNTITVRGDKAHPANIGRLCSKGSALGETLGLEDRLLYPEVHGRQVSWAVALDTVAQGFAKVIAEHGPDAMAFYISGQLLTEDYYVTNKLVKGFIGSGNSTPILACACSLALLATSGPLAATLYPATMRT
jgi:assimilatory nitrate reductase catalytic subunit